MTDTNKYQYWLNAIGIILCLTLVVIGLLTQDMDLAILALIRAVFCRVGMGDCG